MIPLKGKPGKRVIEKIKILVNHLRKLSFYTLWAGFRLSIFSGD